MLASLEYIVSENDRRSGVVRLTALQNYIPETAYINEGPAPDPARPPLGKAPIKITWGTKDSLHFVSAPHGHAPKPRNAAVDEFFNAYGIKAGSQLVIEVPRAGHIVIRAK